MKPKKRIIPASLSISLLVFLCACSAGDETGWVEKRQTFVVGQAGALETPELLLQLSADSLPGEGGSRVEVVARRISSEGPEGCVLASSVFSMEPEMLRFSADALLGVRSRVGNEEGSGLYFRAGQTDQYMRLADATYDPSTERFSARIGELGRAFVGRCESDVVPALNAASLRPVRTASRDGASPPSLVGGGAGCGFPEDVDPETLNLQVFHHSNVSTKVVLEGNYLAEPPDPPVYGRRAGIFMNEDSEVEIRPGTTVYIPENVKIEFYSNERAKPERKIKVVARGTEERPIVFRGLGSAAGCWEQILFEHVSPASIFEHVVFEGGGLAGQSAVVFTDGVTLRHVSIRKSAGDGVTLGGLDASSADIRLDEIAERPVVVAQGLDALVRTLPISLTSVQKPWYFVENPFTEDVVVRGDMQLQSQNYPLHLSGNLDFTPNSALTVAEGNTVRFGSGGEIKMDRENTRLSVYGTEESPVVFEGSVAEPGSWKGLRIGAQSSDQTVLEHVQIRHAGQFDEKAVVIEQAVTLKHLQLLENYGIALELPTTGLRTESRGVRVARSVGPHSAVVGSLNAVGTLGEGSVVTENVGEGAYPLVARVNKDAIELKRSSSATTLPPATHLLPDYGAPYVISEAIPYRGTVSITAGAELIFISRVVEDNPNIVTGTGGKLTESSFDTGNIIALGTQANPVQFSRIRVTGAPENSNVRYSPCIFRASASGSILDFVRLEGELTTENYACFPMNFGSPPIFVAE